MDIPIEGAGCIEHYNTDGSLLFLNGKFADSIKKSHQPMFGREEAVFLLINELKRDERITFAWEYADWEQQIRLDEVDSNATWFPDAELIWAIDTMKNMKVVIPGNRYSLAYKIHIKTITPSESKIYYVDAQNGSILKTHSTQCNNGPAHVYGYGTQIIDTRWSGGFTQAHILHANDNTRDIHTKKNSWMPWALIPNVTSSNNVWGWADRIETSTHYNVTRSWDYFRQTFGRAGFNGIGTGIRVETQVGGIGAWYDWGTNPNELRFGHTTEGWSYGYEPSVVAHEFTHGVTTHTSNLDYEYESGALNESFSDIFGVVIQSLMLDNGSTDWIYGNFVPNDIQHTRSLKAPKERGEHYNSNDIKELGQPDTYQGDFWYDGPLNNGGVHINSGVQNKWFYVLANGDVGHNDLGNFYNVTGIGMQKAAHISYFALTFILQNSSQYSDSRQATISAAKLFYGECSVEHQATIDAWYAVGLGSLNDCDYTLANENFEEIDKEVLIYPNPTKNQITIEVPNKVDNQIIICDATGKKVESFENKNLVFNKNVDHLSNGVYFIKFTINNQPIRRRFIIQK